MFLSGKLTWEANAIVGIITNLVLNGCLCEACTFYSLDVITRLNSRNAISVWIFSMIAEQKLFLDTNMFQLDRK